MNEVFHLDIVRTVNLLGRNIDLNAEQRDHVAHIILLERLRCAEVAKAYLVDIEGCDLRCDEPDLIAQAILAGPSSKARR